MVLNFDFHNLCANIRYLRATHGLSRTAMARKLGITIKTLDMLESESFPRRCTIRLLYNLQRNFGLSLSECFAPPALRLNGVEMDEKPPPGGRLLGRRGRRPRRLSF